MKRIYNITGTTLVFIFVILNVTNARNNSTTDSLNYIQIEGQLIDSETNFPVVFASVFIEGTSVGTVSNTDGEYVLKIPKSFGDKKICFTHIGYALTKTHIENIPEKIKLIPERASIDEVVVRTTDPVKLIKTALNKIPENYSDSKEGYRAFYRETIKQNRRYTAVFEAVADIYKSSYANDFETDKVKINKARKSFDVKRMDTLLFKLQGGPTTLLLLDVAKNTLELFSSENMGFYDYTFEGVITVNDRQSYAIAFDQREGITYPLFSGKIYIDYETMAFSGLEFSLSEKGIDDADKVLVRKRPIGMKIQTLGANYLVTYRLVDDVWQLNYVRAEAGFKCKWDKKLFSSNYYTMSEMAITKKLDAIEKYNRNEIFKSNQSLADKLAEFTDDIFWGDDNTIKPDESIESAIKRLNDKLE